MWISSSESSFGSMSLSWTRESAVVLKMMIVLDEMRSKKERERRNITLPSPYDKVESGLKHQFKIEELINKSIKEPRYAFSTLLQL